MKKGTLKWVLTGLLGLVSFPVCAASLQVAPISLQFSSTENAKEIWLTNTSDKAIRAQTRVQEWTQQSGTDVLISTKNIVASPMVTEIPAGEKQLIRVMKVSELPKHQEQSYRLIIDELPSPSQPTERSGLQLLLQYSIPVFFKPEQNIPLKNSLTSLDQVDFSYDQHRLIVKNRGNSHIRISQLNYINTNSEKVPVITGLVGYALSGQTMSWNIPVLKSMLPNGKFEAKINADGQAQILNFK